MINRKTLFGVVATIAATSAFSYPVNLTCLLYGSSQSTKIAGEGMVTFEVIDRTFTAVSFDKDFNPKNYGVYYANCSKKLLSQARSEFSVGYNIYDQYLYYDPSNITNYLHANSTLFKDKFNLLFQRSINGLYLYSQFESDVNQSMIYITTPGTNVTNISKARTDKYLTLYSETGDNQIFRSKKQLPNNSEDAVEIITDGIISTQKFSLDKDNADTLAQFIVTTGHKLSFVGMLDRMLYKRKARLIYDQKNMSVSYEILSVKKEVVNLRVMTMVKALNLTASPESDSRNIDFTKSPVTINIAMNVTIYPDLTGMIVEIPFKDIKMDISPTPKYSKIDPYDIIPKRSPSDVVQMYLKNSLMNGLYQRKDSRDYGRYSIHNSNDIDIFIVN